MSHHQIIMSHHQIIMSHHQIVRPHHQIIMSHHQIIMPYHQIIMPNHLIIFERETATESNEGQLWLMSAFNAYLLILISYNDLDLDTIVHAHKFGLAQLQVDE